MPVGDVDARAARGDGAGLADREVRREARPRPASHHAARRRHRRGARAAQGARHPPDRRAAAAGRRGALVAFIHPVGGARRAGRAEAGGGDSHQSAASPQPSALSPDLIGRSAIHARRSRAHLAVRRLLRASTAARCSAWCPTLWEKRRRPTTRNRIPLGDAAADRPRRAHDDHRRRSRRQGEREVPRHLRRRSRAYHLDHALAEAGLSPRTSTSCSPPICTSITSAASPIATRRAACVPRFPRAQYVVAARRVGGCDASARAQPRQLPAGQLRAAGRRRRPAAGRRRRRRSCRACGPADRRSHGASPDRDDRIEAASGRVRRRLIPTTGAPPRPVDHGLRPVSDGHAGVQEAAFVQRSARARIPWCSSSTTRRWRPATSARQDGKRVSRAELTQRTPWTLREDR